MRDQPPGEVAIGKFDTLATYTLEPGLDIPAAFFR